MEDILQHPKLIAHEAALKAKYARPSLDSILAARNASAGPLGPTMFLDSPGSLLQAAAEAAQKSAPIGGKSATTLLPKGISGGRIATYVAGAAVIAGGIHLLTRKKAEPEQSWQGRIQAERSSATRETGRTS